MPNLDGSMPLPWTEDRLSVGALALGVLVGSGLAFAVIRPAPAPVVPIEAATVTSSVTTPTVEPQPAVIEPPAPPALETPPPTPTAEARAPAQARPSPRSKTKALAPEAPAPEAAGERKSALARRLSALRTAQPQRATQLMVELNEVDAEDTAALEAIEREIQRALDEP